MKLQSYFLNPKYNHIGMTKKIRFLISVLPLLCITFISIGGTNTINGEVYSLSNDKAILGRYYQDQYIFLDTVKIEAGKFSFTIEDNLQIGMYFIQVDKYKIIEVIYNKENIDFSTDYYHHKEDFLEKSSPTNKRYYKKIHEQQALQKEIQNQRILSVKLGKTDFEKNLAKELYKEAKIKLSNFYEDLRISKNQYFTDGLVLAQFQPSADDNLTVQEQQTVVKTSYFDYVDTQDTILLYANIIPKKLYNYIMLYRSRSLSPKAQDSSYRKCVDQLILVNNKQSKVTDFLFSFLVDNFTRMQIENVLPYIKSEYLKKYKKESIVTEKIDQEIFKIESLKPGHVAPNFSHIDIVGNQFELHKYKSEYTLVMFWASWCGHCRHTLPTVKILYDDQPTKKVQVVAISLDSKEEEWKKFLTDGDYNWINITDLKSWEGDIAKSYMVHSTPTFYLLNKDKKIIKKGKQISEFEPYFK